MNTQKTWTPQDKQFLEDNIEKMTLPDLAKHFNRSQLAVKCFIIRERLPYRNQVKVNLLIELLELRFGNPRYFKPNREFYRSVQMSQIRFWKLYRGEVNPTEKEYNTLKDHFNITVENIEYNRQLELFNPEI